MNNIAIFASGNGSNAEAIMDYFAARPLLGRVVCVLSNNEGALALERARRRGVLARSFSAKQLRESPDEVLAILDECGATFIVLAGFMLLVPSAITARFSRCIVNIHPALLPSYGGRGMYGERVHRAVLDDGAAVSGITIHYVNERYDEGDIIFQQRVDVLPGDDVESLAARIHRQEHLHYPRVIGELLCNREL